MAVVVISSSSIVAILYYTTPNVKQPKFRWLSLRAIVAILVWIVASAAFPPTSRHSGATPTARSPELLWLWINLALLFEPSWTPSSSARQATGRHRGRGGAVQLPARDTRGITKARKKEQKDLARGRAMRANESITTDTREKTP